MPPLLLFKSKSLVNDSIKSPVVVVVVVDILDLSKTENMHASTSKIDDRRIVNFFFIIWPRPVVVVKIILPFEEGINANDSDDGGGGRRIGKKPSSSPLPQSLFFAVAMEEEEDTIISYVSYNVSLCGGEANQLPLPQPAHFRGSFRMTEETPLRAAPRHSSSHRRLRIAFNSVMA